MLLDCGLLTAARDGTRKQVQPWCVTCQPGQPACLPARPPACQWQHIQVCSISPEQTGWEQAINVNSGSLAGASPSLDVAPACIWLRSAIGAGRVGNAPQESRAEVVTSAVSLPPPSGCQRARVQSRGSRFGLDDAQEWAVSTWLAGRPLVRREVSTTNGRAGHHRVETRADGHVRDGDCALT